MSWAIYLDRRRTTLEDVLGELESLRASIPGITLALTDTITFQSAPDHGKFRDFAFVGVITHHDPEVQEWLAEELVDQLGWAVDIRPWDVQANPRGSDPQ